MLTIIKKIQANLAPHSSSQDLCAVALTIETDGRVAARSVDQSSGDQEFDDSVLRAVDQASPLPVPADPQLFLRRMTLRIRGNERPSSGFPKSCSAPVPGPQSADLIRAERVEWAEKLQTAIRNNRVQPLGTGNLRGRAHVEISRDGHVVSRAIEESSGDAEVDADYLRAIDEADPLPVPCDTSVWVRSLNISFVPGP